MRILFLVHQFMPDFAAGTERVTLNLARAAQSEGHNVEVLTVHQGEGAGWRRTGDGFLAATVEGVPVTAIRARERPLIDLGFQASDTLAADFARFLKGRSDFDLAHVMHAFRLTEAVEALAAARVPYVVTLTDFFAICHRMILMRVDGDRCGGPEGGRACATYCPVHELSEAGYAQRVARYRGMLERASAVVAVSDYVAQRFKAEHPHVPLRVIPNGVDLLGFGPPAPRGGGPLTIGFLGTVSESKGALMLARAFAASGAHDARLRFVGPLAEPEAAEAIRRLAETAPISLDGPVPQDRVAEALAGFDVLAVPSRWPETFSLVLHEGFAVGLPALVSDIGNLGEVIGRSGAGLALDPFDEAAWAGAIKDLAARPERLMAWKNALPLPWRVEEEGFLYGRLYRAVTPLPPTRTASPAPRSASPSPRPG